LPAVSDFTADGPFTATSGDVTSVSCTIFRPTVLGANGCLNPVIVWGNGTTNTPSNYTALFNHFATQGFIVAAADTSNAGSGTEMLACLTYMIDQNGTAGSPYEGHIDVNNIASSGDSQGGAGCLEAGIDPRFKVTAAVSAYIVIPLGGYDTTSVMKQIHPMFLISGSADTVAVPANNQEPIFMTAPVPIFWGTHAGSTHFEVLDTGRACAGPLTAWFRYKLMGDQSAEQWFEKPTCTLCSASGWTVQTNSLWM
jgi:predicted dienelactone hydrolase